MELNQNIKENLIKNIIIIIGALLFYPVITNAILKIQTEQISNFLLVISMLLVTVCFANFAFTYEKSKLRNSKIRFLSHGATLIFMLLIALFLESIAVAVKVAFPSFHILNIIFSILLYVGVILYDFWDLLKFE
jgi:hypothetical protein